MNNNPKTGLESSEVGTTDIDLNDAFPQSVREEISESVRKDDDIRPEPKQEYSQPSYEEDEQQEEKYSREEQEAMREGWLPKDQFKGDPDNWTPVRQWRSKKELLEKIGYQNRKMDMMARKIDELTNYFAENASRSSQNALENLKERRRQAILAQDVDAVEKLDEEMLGYHGDIEKYKPAAEARSRTKTREPQLTQDVQDFLTENSSWFNDVTEENSAMKQYAIEKDKRMQQTHRHLPEWDRLQLVKQETFKYFGKVRQTGRNRPSGVVETSNNNFRTSENSSGGRYPSFNSLPRHIQDMIVMQERLLPNPDPNYRKEYIKELKDSGAI